MFANAYLVGGSNPSRSTKFNKGYIMRKYNIPAKIIKHHLVFNHFKEWIVEQGMEIIQPCPLIFKRTNGRQCTSFRNDTCTREFLAVSRDFLMKEYDYYPSGTRPDSFYDNRRKEKQMV